MRFLHPQVFWSLIVLLPLAVGLELAVLRCGESFRLSSDELLPVRRFSRVLIGRILVILLKLLAVVFLVAALARPQRSVAVDPERTKGIHVVLCLDVSKTMNAQDFKPENRIKAAKSVLTDFIRKDHHDRIGLVVFAGVSFVQCPLTLDREVLSELLARVDVEETVLVDGTAVGDAIVTSVNMLKADQAKSRVVILATDGINNTGVDPREAARLAATQQVVLYTIGIGRQGGAPMVVRRNGRWLPAVDYLTGKVQRVPEPDEKLLTELATMTGGQYFRATDERTLGAIYRRIGEMTQEEFKKERTTRDQDAPGIFILLGLGCLLLERLLAGTLFRISPA